MPYFTVSQIEKFYSVFFPKWKKEAYYELLKKLQVLPSQKLSTMSCGQRSQVALGLLFAQDPELLILDDFSMGLDPAIAVCLWNTFGNMRRQRTRQSFSLRTSFRTWNC